MTPELRELLHASIQWRHARDLARDENDTLAEGEPFSSVTLDMLATANRRLMAATLAAERANPPEKQGATHDQ